MKTADNNAINLGSERYATRYGVIRSQVAGQR
jgi:hypothetical protein